MKNWDESQTSTTTASSSVGGDASAESADGALPPLAMLACRQTRLAFGISPAAVKKETISNSKTGEFFKSGRESYRELHERASCAKRTPWLDLFLLLRKCDQIIARV